MRRVIRQAVKIDSWYWIIALSLLLFGIFMVFNQQADAISRTEFNELKEQEDTAKENIDDLDEELSEQRDKIREQEDEIDSLKHDLKSVETGSDWDSIKEKIDLEKSVQDALDVLRDYRDRLGEIIREKSDNIKLLKVLNYNITNSNIDTFNYSNLTKKIGIEYSNTCRIALENGIQNPCGITYKNLITLDSSDTNISGKFSTDENGNLYRQEPKQKNSWRLYDFDEQPRIFVDPPKGMSERIKMIEIRPNFDTYTLANSMYQPIEYELTDYISNKTIGNVTKSVTLQFLNQTQEYGRVVFHDRYVNDSCTKAVINADKAKELLPDTIHLMRNNCDRNITQFEEREVIPIERSYQDITTSQKYKDEQRLEYIKEFCIFKYKQC